MGVRLPSGLPAYRPDARYPAGGARARVDGFGYGACGAGYHGEAGVPRAQRRPERLRPAEPVVLRPAYG